ncbi:hypothetical protein [Deinococcus sp.]|uniref:hypothetical protein n=1 Tax=Deinococcus sp. TaxID=47478 RepID=UPI003C7DAECC
MHPEFHPVQERPRPGSSDSACQAVSVLIISPSRTARPAQSMSALRPTTLAACRATSSGVRSDWASRETSSRAAM